MPSSYLSDVGRGLEVSAKPELMKLLAALSVGANGPILAGQQLDLYRTYGANCKEAPLLPLMALPGFGPLALANDPGGALLKFKSFCCSQFGQRKRFRIVFVEGLRDSGYRRVRASFSDKVAEDYTSHASRKGQRDVYVGIQAGDIILLLGVDDDWSFVRSYHHAMPHDGWVPTAYICTKPI